MALAACQSDGALDVLAQPQAVGEHLGQGQDREAEFKKYDSLFKDIQALAKRIDDDQRVVGEARDGREAVEMVDRLRPDLLFLDVQLPEMNGLAVLRQLTHVPEVIFTTAYDGHAVAAFELGAVDYLVKPFGGERFLETLERARRRLDPGASPSPAERVLSALAPPLERLFARTGDRIVPIAAREIRRIEACGDYARVHTADGSHLLHVSLTELEERLQSESDAIDRRRRRLVAARRLGPSSKPHDEDRSKVDLAPRPTLSSRMSVSLGRRGQSRVWTIRLKDAATVNIPRCRAA